MDADTVQLVDAPDEAELDRPRPQRHRRSTRKHRAGLHRTSIACERCRIRKHKCDGASPVCTPCDRVGAECIVADRLTHRLQARDHVEALERENEALRRRIESLERTHRPSGTSGVQASPFTPVSVPGTGDHEKADHAVPLGRTALGRVAGNAESFVGESGGSYFGNVVESVLGHHGTASSNLARAHFEHSGSDNAQGAQTAHPQVDVDLDELSAELLFRLEDAFFDYRWPTLPFLHRPTFHNEYMPSFLELRGKAPPSTVFVVMMVMAIGAVDLARKDPSLRPLPRACLQVAMACHVNANAHNNTVLMVQAFLLLALLAIVEPCNVDAWNASGQAVRTAIALGLHRKDHAMPGTRTRLQTEMRKRVFWCAFAMDQNVSLALGRPAAIRLADIDAEMPLGLTDLELFEDTREPVNPSRTPRQNDMSSFIHIIELRRLRARTQDTLYPAKPLIDSAEAERQRTVIHRQLDDLASRAPRFNQAEVATYQTIEWQQIIYSQSLLLLYRPSPACPTLTNEALQVCHENAINFVTSYTSLYAKNKIAYTWLSLQSLFMASVCMLYTLWVGPNIRRQAAPAVVKSNLKLCLMLFEVMEETWPLAARCRSIVQHMGDATLGLFETIPALTDTRISIGRTSQAATQPSVNAADHFPGNTAALSLGGRSHDHQSSLQGPSFHDEDATRLEAVENANFLDLFADTNDFSFLDFDLNLPLMTDMFDCGERSSGV